MYLFFLPTACEVGDLLAFKSLSRWAGYNPQTQEKLNEAVFFKRLFLVAGSSTNSYNRFKIATLMLGRQKGLHHKFLNLSKVGEDGSTALSLACKHGLVSIFFFFCPSHYLCHDEQ